ncbi:dockerin type I domain-containing protein [Ruminococcus sp.]|uniref:heparinase II/III domain-containing protein n=1 Tax=Ruminococcus sp. TaxID=41978 RepID=UPI0025DBDBC9|nr:dockerin type I domain-containing protein [Ruminococcus sp.]
MKKLFFRAVSALTFAAVTLFTTSVCFQSFFTERKANAAEKIITEDMSAQLSYDGDLDGLVLHKTKLYDDLENIGGYERPSVKTIVSDYEKSPQHEKHPRLMITSDFVKTLKKEVNDPDNPKSWWFSRLKTRGDLLYEQLTGPSQKDYLISYEKCYETRIPGIDGNKSKASDEFRYKIMTFGMLYQLTGEKKYADAAWVILERVISFKDINPWHDLDFGFFCQGYALAYDWMFSAWDPDQTAALEEAIMRHCFRPANDAYTDNTITRSQDWTNAVVRGVYTNHNHNPIVNSGIAMAAIAFMDKYPAITPSLCHDAFICLERDLNMYAPDGMTTEGLEYMLISVDNLSMLFSSLETSLGHLYGLDTCPGMENGKPIRVIHSLESDVGELSFGDSHDLLLTYPGELYFYKHYDLHGFKSEIYDRLKTGSANDFLRNVQILCWYEPDSGDQKINFDKDMNVGGDAAFATLRSSFEAKQSFVGIKAGTTLRDYFVHLDQGSFVFNSLGVKWAADMGKDNYDLAGYMDPRAEDNRRFRIFRLRPDGHNTLLINPSTTDFGYEFNKTAVISTESSETQAKAVVNMTDLVSSKASSAQRGFLLTDNRRSLVVRDEVALKKSSDLYWIMYTPQNVKINGSSATLSSIDDESVQLRLDLTSSAKGTLYKEPAAPWALAPKVEGQAENEEYTRIVYKITGASDSVNITAKLTPLISETASAPDVSTYGAISSWDLDNGSGSGESAYMLGDVDNNGLIDAVDSSQVHEHYALVSTNQNVKFNDLQEKAADVNIDGLIDAVDASQILAYYTYASTASGKLIPMEDFKTE